MSFEGSREGQTWRGVVKLEHLLVGIVEDLVSIVTVVRSYRDPRRGNQLCHVVVDLVSGEKLVLRERLFAEARVMVKLS